MKAELWECQIADSAIDVRHGAFYKILRVWYDDGETGLVVTIDRHTVYVHRGRDILQTSCDKVWDFESDGTIAASARAILEAEEAIRQSFWNDRYNLPPQMANLINDLMNSRLESAFDRL